MRSTDELLDLIDQIYTAGAAPVRRPRMLGTLAALFGAASARVLVRQRASGRVLQSSAFDCDWVGSDFHDRYVRDWSTADPRLQALTSLPAGEVLRCQHHLAPGTVASSPMYQEFLIPHGLRWSMSAIFDSHRDTYSQVSALRAPDAPAFEDGAARTLRQLLPHFRRAALLHRHECETQATDRTGAQLLRLLPLPCVLTDRAGRCIEANEPFRAAMRSLGIQPVLGRLRFDAADLQARWEQALADTHATALGRTLPAPELARPSQVHLVPWHCVATAPDAGEHRLILAIFEDKGCAVPASQALLSARSRLTPAELEVLSGLLQGLPAKAIARQRNASFNTIRSQITRILDKTGHHSQRELIASFGASSFSDSLGPG